MATREQQARWVAKNRDRWNAYQREYYRKTHPNTRKDLVGADMRALGRWTKWEKMVRPSDLVP